MVIDRGELLIGSRRIGRESPCFVIAEVGVNHNGDVGMAREMIDLAARSGADAVKFQTFDPDLLAAPDAPKAEYQKRNDASSRSQLEMLRDLALSREAHEELRAYAESRSILFLSSPFDERSADLLVDLGVPALKIPSGEVTNHPFLAYVARLRRPMLMSTGMCTLAEVRDAVEAIRAAGDPPIALFHCVSNYPAAAGDSNLRAMATLRSSFGVPVGWSDHTSGIDISLAAVALGAELIEKHFTLDRSLPGPDHAASLLPDELTALVRDVRRVEVARGTGEKVPTKAELAVARIARKSLRWASSLGKGATASRKDIVALRPGDGIPPSRIADVMRVCLSRDVIAGARVEWEDLDP